VNHVHRWIEPSCRGATHESFSADQKTVDAVARDITVIGEAARNVPAEVVARHPEIPWNEMREMRNVVTQGYFGASTRIVREPDRQLAVVYRTSTHRRKLATRRSRRG